jgi:hypothetical protein
MASHWILASNRLPKDLEKVTILDGREIYKGYILDGNWFKDDSQPILNITQWKE